MIFERDDREAAESFVAESPYLRAGLYEDHRLYEYQGRGRLTPEARVGRRPQWNTLRVTASRFRKLLLRLAPAGEQLG